MVGRFRVSRGDVKLLTEASVERSFRGLLKGPEIAADAFDKAEDLLDQLRPESPLRHRLSEELEELREVSLSGK